MNKRGNIFGLPNITPGPWDHNGNWVISNYKGHPVAQVISDGDLSIGDSNASLISAAPELFAQLSQAVRYFEDNGGESDFSFLPAMKFSLTKARG